MLAKLTRELPVGEFLYEPKWDGFRAIVFRDGDHVEIGSRNEKPLTRYFPELVEPIRAQLPEQCVVDGEIVIATERGLDFDLLSLRIHPAASRIEKLAGETPASFVAFDATRRGERGPAAPPVRGAPGAVGARCSQRRDITDAAAHAGDARSRARGASGSSASRAPASTE